MDVAAGSWGVEAVIEIISDRGEIIDDISFNNLCAVYPKFEAFLVSTVDEEGTGFKTYVYKLRANFSFISSASYYPFDVQDLFVEYVLRPKLNELLPPIPKPQLDNEFEINGWQHIKSYSSVKRNKSFLKLGANLAKVVSLETANRFGVIIQRHEPVNLIKILAPLTFLTLIAYYCLFLPTGDTFNKLITLVTVFLSGIALYFATEKPQPLEFSLIDKIFQFFYAVLGTNILITLTLEFHLFFGGLLVTCFQILQPIGLAAFLIYLFKEKKKMEVMIGK